MHGRSSALPPIPVAHTPVLTCAPLLFTSTSTKVMADPAHLEGILADGAGKADAIASATLGWAKDAMGFYTLPGKQA